MRRAFTLLEVLIVIAIIVLMALIIFPVFASVRASARRTVCISQLRQIGMGISLYQQDYEGLPQHLSQTYPTYVNATRLFVCPNDRKQGQYDGNSRLEGNLYLASGVSYEYFPQWEVAQELGWYKPAPRFGSGKWDDLTPLAGCAWHWAKSFDINLEGNLPNARGWELILTLGGSVRKIRVEEPLAEFTPKKYQ